jgi:hypothetical protein
MLRQRLDGRFARIVRGVSRRVRDTLLASCDDDGGWFCGGVAGEEGWSVCVQAVDDAKEVGIEDLESGRSAQRLCDEGGKFCGVLISFWMLSWVSCYRRIDTCGSLVGGLGYQVSGSFRSIEWHVFEPLTPRVCRPDLGSPWRWAEC